MPHKIEFFCCDNCNKKFDKFFDCIAHEAECDPCLSCKNATYLNSTDFVCQYQHLGKCSPKSKKEYVKRGTDEN